MPEAATSELVVFADRVDAGRRLGRRLRSLRIDAEVVLGLPRGGVVVAAEVARILEAPLDVVVVRKIGAPGRPELGLGAVGDGAEPVTILNEELVATLHVSAAYLEQEIATQLAEVRRRQAVLRGGRPAIALRDRAVVVVDDGIATGGTVGAALRLVRRTMPRRLVLAVPVAPPEALAELEPFADQVVCLSAPSDLVAVGRSYVDFRQTTDDEVIALLAERA